MSIKRVLFFTLIFLAAPTHAMEPHTSRTSISQVGPNELTYGLQGHGLVGDGRIQIDYCFLFRRHVQKWLARGVNIDACTSDGHFTPLSYAAFRGEWKKCKILLDLGANVNGAAAELTPLAAALYSRSKQRRRICELLLAHGADVNLRSERTGKTAIMAQIERNSHDFTGINPFDLLKMGADPLIVDFDGNNALMCAAGYARRASAHAVIWSLLAFFSYKNHIVDLRLFTFLCCLKRILRIGTQHEKYIASALYSNRKLFMQPFIRHVPPLRDILELVNNRGQTAFDIHTPFHAIEQFSAAYLNPVNAEATAKFIELHVYFRDKWTWLLRIAQCN